MDSNHRYRKISYRFETDFYRLHEVPFPKGIHFSHNGNLQFEAISLQRSSNKPHMRVIVGPACEAGITPLSRLGKGKLRPAPEAIENPGVVSPEAPKPLCAHRAPRTAHLVIERRCLWLPTTPCDGGILGPTLRD